MKPTLKQIAERTGYSISTISRSLANSPSISKKTREDVQRAASDVGYRPMTKKRPQRKKKKQLHFALLSDFRIGEFYASLFCGYRDASYKEDVRISLLSVRDQKEECVRFIQQVQRENNYDGFILFFPALERQHYEEILKVLPSGFPIVSNALIDNPNIATITFDSYSGGHLAAAHFHRQGFKRLGIIDGPVNRPESRFRSNGFLDYIHQHSDLELNWRFNGTYEFQSGVDAFQQFVAQKKGLISHQDEGSQIQAGFSGGDSTENDEKREEPALPADAVFATNDSMAMGFMESAKSSGVRIPEDLAILGYDNLPSVHQRTPKLSSIDTDFIELGVSSIKALKNKIRKQGHKHGTLSLIPVHLENRESAELFRESNPG